MCKHPESLRQVGKSCQNYFAALVIGGMGSIAGSIVTGLALGVIEGLTKVFYPEASSVSIFVIMILVLLFKPAGLFGKVR